MYFPGFPLHDLVKISLNKNYKILEPFKEEKCIILDKSFLLPLKVILSQ